MKPKEHIGNGVYAEIRAGVLVLTAGNEVFSIGTEDDLAPNVTIYLDAKVLGALLTYIQKGK